MHWTYHNKTKLNCRLNLYQCKNQKVQKFCLHKEKKRTHTHTRAVESKVTIVIGKPSLQDQINTAGFFNANICTPYAYLLPFSQGNPIQPRVHTLPQASPDKPSTHTHTNSYPTYSAWLPTEPQFSRTVFSPHRSQTTNEDG